MENKNGDTIKIVVGAVIILVIFIFIIKPKANVTAPVVSPTTDQTVNQTATTTKPVVKKVVSKTTTGTVSDLQTITAYNVSVSAPKTLTITSELVNYGASIGIENITIANGNKIANNPLILKISKYPSQSRLTEDFPQGKSSDWTSINNTYSIGGTTGTYYNNNLSSGETIIVVPSKLTLITVEPISFSGVTQAVLNQIISSIKFN